MNAIRSILISLGATLLFVPLISAQDLSKYRQFSLGASLTEVSKQIGQQAGDASVIQQNPATLQQLEWWPVALNFLTKPEPVEKVVFSFYNGTLYKIEVTYNSDATAGLTNADIIGAISASYGRRTEIGVAITTTSNGTYGADEAIAQWENTKHSVSLRKVSFLNTFTLVVLTKQMNAEADASIAAAAAQARVNAPQKEIDRGKKATNDMETQRQANLKTFRP